MHMKDFKAAEELVQNIANLEYEIKFLKKEIKDLEDGATNIRESDMYLTSSGIKDEMVELIENRKEELVRQLREL